MPHRANSSVLGSTHANSAWIQGARIWPSNSNNFGTEIGGVAISFLLVIYTIHAYSNLLLFLYEIGTNLNVVDIAGDIQRVAAGLKPKLAADTL